MRQLNGQLQIRMPYRTTLAAAAVASSQLTTAAAAERAPPFVLPPQATSGGSGSSPIEGGVALELRGFRGTKLVRHGSHS